MSYLGHYKKRVGLYGNNQKDIITNKNIHKFNMLVEREASSHKVIITRPNEATFDVSKTVSCLISDYKENDNSWGEEKIMLVKVDEDIECGCYVK